MKKSLIVFIVIAVVIVYLIPAGFSFILGGLLGTTETELATKHQEKTYDPGYTYSELTREQRLEDFEYFCEMVRTSLPNIYDMDELYGMSFFDRIPEYRRMVEECENDYRFTALMTYMINDLPSGHASFMPPDYTDYFSVGYFRTETVGMKLSDNLRGKLEAYDKYLRQLQKTYDAKNYKAYTFSYFSGDYVCLSSGGFSHAVIQSVNGKNAAEYFSSAYAVSGQLFYDAGTKKPYRDRVVLSTDGTQPVEVTMKLLDNSVVTETLYIDYDYCYAAQYAFYYGEQYVDSNTDEIFEDIPDATDDDISIITVEEYDLAYVMLSSLEYSSGTAFTDKLKEISSCENIIIDLRGNGGGVSSFWDNYIYPALYKDDAHFVASGIMPDNEYTDRLLPGWFGGEFSLKLSGIDFEKNVERPAEMFDCNNGKYKKYTFTHDMKGNKELNYSDTRKVYYIVNNYTCSAADEIAQIVKECNLGKIVGSNTLGEGRIFGVCNDWLPNSLLMYNYCPCYIVDSEGVNNGIVGTMPDIYGGTTAEGLIASDLLDAQGINSLHPDNRLVWDRNYMLILRDIGNIAADAA
ncbi:MAG: S41 family peptidase [Oscillospiraceae bacterium]